MFDEVLKEQCYKKKHNALKTSDVMCRKNDNYIFFECKSTVPYAKTRCLDENYIKQEIDKISNYVLQLYKQDRIVLQFFKQILILKLLFGMITKINRYTIKKRRLKYGRIKCFKSKDILYKN